MKFYLFYDVFSLARYFILINNRDIIFDVKSHINNNKHIVKSHNIYTKFVKMS